jgi:hypothetical protein
MLRLPLSILQQGPRAPVVLCAMLRHCLGIV